MRTDTELRVELYRAVDALVEQRVAEELSKRAAPRATMQGLLDAAGYASQKDLARATGLIESSISDYVRTGARNLKAETLTTLAKALRVPPVDVLAALHETRRQSLQLHRPGVPA